MNNNVSPNSRTFGYVERFVEPCILLLLSRNPSYGYRLIVSLEKHCGKKVDIGNLYRTLRKMEHNGWIKSDWEKGSIGPKKRRYQITSKGEEILKKAAIYLKRTQTLISHFFVGYKKLFKKGG